MQYQLLINVECLLKNYSINMAKSKNKTLQITQIKSRIGYKKKAKATLDAMGLKK